MRKVFVASISAALLAGVFLVTAPDGAEARCATFKGSHNGTDMFHPEGAIGPAKAKLFASIEAWKRQRGIKRVRIGRVRTKCGEWYIKYLLPHHTCVATARACG